jgi:GNAT superfamily N-acetyltransferase
VTVITAAEPSHLEAIATLAEEMDRYYGGKEFEPLEFRLAQINEALFSQQPPAHALLAWDTGRLVGLAAYSFLWPAVGLTRSIFLKELYVVEAARRTGVGLKLMQALFNVALKLDCSRVEWQTETANEEARRFYATLGVPEFAGKAFYRLEGASLHQMASRED